MGCPIIKFGRSVPWSCCGPEAHAHASDLGGDHRPGLDQRREGDRAAALATLAGMPEGEVAERVNQLFINVRMSGVAG
jgi:hypothetical protein